MKKVFLILFFCGWVACGSQSETASNSDDPNLGEGSGGDGAKAIVDFSLRVQTKSTEDEALDFVVSLPDTLSLPLYILS